MHAKRPHAHLYVAAPQGLRLGMGPKASQRARQTSWSARKQQLRSHLEACSKESRSASLRIDEQSISSTRM